MKSVIKIYEEGDNIRLTFNWLLGVEQVYVYTLEGHPDRENKPFEGLPIGSDDGKLFTLQEYKERGGYVTKKTPGVTTYYICPFLREDGEDVILTQDNITFTCRTVVEYSIREKLGRYKNHLITLSSKNTVPEDVICYVKKANGFPVDIGDGILYYLSGLPEGGKTMTWVVRTEGHEFIRVFIRNEYEELYSMLRR